MEIWGFMLILLKVQHELRAWDRNVLLCLDKCMGSGFTCFPHSYIARTVKSAVKSAIKKLI